MDFVSSIGYLVLVSMASRFLSTICRLLRYYLFTSLGYVKDLSKYGKWVVVTGATDGIGKEYALQFAKRGFNIVLISRNQTKLDSVAKEIEGDSNVETKTICFDFGETSGYENIENEIRDLDVGILINNVGTGTAKVKEFHECSVEKMFDMVHINDFSFMSMSHMVLKGMIERERGAIVNISSGVVYQEYCPVPVYAATKTFMNALIKSLKLEYCGVIDQQVVIPFGVATNIPGGPKNEDIGFFVVTPKVYVESAIKTIGIADVTHGHINHEIVALILKSIPSFVLTYIARKFAQKMKEKEA